MYRHRKALPHNAAASLRYSSGYESIGMSTGPSAKLRVSASGGAILFCLPDGADHVKPAIVHGIALAGQDRFTAGERVLQSDMAARLPGERLCREQRLCQKTLQPPCSPNRQLGGISPKSGAEASSQGNLT